MKKIRSVLGLAYYRLIKLNKNRISLKECVSILMWPPGVLREPGDTVKHILKELEEDNKIHVDKNTVFIY